VTALDYLTIHYLTYVLLNLNTNGKFSKSTLIMKPPNLTRTNYSWPMLQCITAYAQVPLQIVYLCPAKPKYQMPPDSATNVSIRPLQPNDTLHNRNISIQRHIIVSGNVTEGACRRDSKHTVRSGHQWDNLSQEAQDSTCNIAPSKWHYASSAFKHCQRSISLKSISASSSVSFTPQLTFNFLLNCFALHNVY
jgi:hypothetical protein